MDQVLLKTEGVPDLVARAYDQAIWETEAGELQVLGPVWTAEQVQAQLDQLNENLFQDKT